MSTISEIEPQIDLKEVWMELHNTSLIRSKKSSKLLRHFATLMSQKSSFAHKAHKEFERLMS